MPKINQSGSLLVVLGLAVILLVGTVIYFARTSSTQIPNTPTATATTTSPVNSPKTTAISTNKPIKSSPTSAATRTPAPATSQLPLCQNVPVPSCPPGQGGEMINPKDPSCKMYICVSPTSAGGSSEPNIDVTTNCASDHDSLGNHLDVTIKFENLEKLNSNDLIVSVIDSTTQNRSESHVSTTLINNQTIPAHKYAYAFQGSLKPLELVPDGREYLVRIMKATYKTDGTIDVYSQALERKFSKKCSF